MGYVVRAMVTLELVVLLGAMVLAGEIAARRLRLPAPLVLLAAGSALSFAPGLHNVKLQPDVVLLLFLPALVYWESLSSTSLREIRSNARAILLAAVGLVLATALCVMAAASALGLSWPLALALGAIVAPTDATAVANVNAALPRRTSAILRTESLVNDGTSLTLYSVAVGAAVTGKPPGIPLFGAEIVGSALGAIAIGLAVGGLVLALRHLLPERHLSSTLSLLTPFLAFLPAEVIHASGVVAVVTCGIVMVQGGPRTYSAADRRQAFGFWQVVSFVLNDALFVLTGLRLHRIIAGLGARSWPLVLALSWIVIAIVIGLRLLWFIAGAYAPLPRRPEQDPASRRARHRVPLAWSGMRGSISLAAAFALPLTTSAGKPLPHREALLAVTFTVIVFTLIAQGLSLPAILRWSRLPPDPTQAYEEALATRTTFLSALAGLRTAADRLGSPQEVRDRLLAEFRAEADQLHSMMDDKARSVRPREAATIVRERQLRRAVIPGKRRAVFRLRHAGRIDDIVLRRMQALLDAEELRLTEYENEGI